MRSSPADEWRSVHIAEIADVIGGGTPSTKDPANFDGGIPWISPKDLSGWSGVWIARGARDLSPKGLAGSSARLLPRGTVLVSSRAPIGYVALAANEVATNQGFRSLVLRDGNDPEFFFYLMKTLKPVLEAAANGTTFKEISGSSLKQIGIRAPALAEQQRIAWVLRTLDNKRRASQAVQRTADDLLHQLFRRALAAERSGRWDSRVLGDLCKFRGGNAFPQSMQGRSAGDLPFIKVSDLADPGNETHITGARHWVDKCDLGLLKAKPFVMGAVVFAKIGEGLRANRVRLITGPTLLDNNLMGATPIDGRISSPLLYALLSDLGLPDHAVGSALPYLRAKDLSVIRIELPPAADRGVLETALQALSEQAAAASREARAVQQVRDALLPKLVSGEIRVPDTADVQEAVETATAELDENGTVPETVTTAAA
jgi:type I restriction enzyme, S subunit